MSEKSAVSSGLKVQYVSRLFLAILVCLVTLPSGAALADQHRSVLLEPNGVDDTSALQGALDNCAALPGQCHIRLAEGVFHTAPLVATGFVGSIRGAGMDLTTIRPPAGVVLHITKAFPFNTVDPTPADPWPALISFIESKVHLSALTVELPADTKIDGWYPVCMVSNDLFPVMSTAIWATSRGESEFIMRDVAIIGAEDPGSEWIYVMLQSLVLGGWLLPADYTDPCTDWLPASGTIVLDNNVFETAWAAAYGENMTDANIRFTHNQTRDMLVEPFSFYNCHRSKVVVAHNQIESIYGPGLFFLQNAYLAADAPSKEDTEFHLFKNHITVGEYGFAGIWYRDDRSMPTTTVNIHHNDISMGAETVAGIGVVQASGASVQSNRIAGAPQFGLAAMGSTDCRLGMNDLDDLSPSVAHVLLDEGSSDCRVVVRDAELVLDLGTNNTIIYH